MDISSTQSKANNKNVKSGVQVLNKFISLNPRPITIFVPNNIIKEETSIQRRKIPRPANAFMLFANENRRRVANLHPLESNKEISIRLGTQWKNLSPVQKDKYFNKAKQVDADHKKKYPDYVYNPKEARIRKALRDRERSIANSATVRSRRSNWSRQSPAPQMPPIVHTDPRMNIPNKDFRSVIRHELEHGFLANTSNYMYPSQPYLFPPQSEYMSYINAIPSSNWTPNTYNMQSNNVVQQQIWNQYQNDRARAQQNQGTSYVLNPQGPPPEYQIEHMPTNNVQMGPASKSNIHQNLENAASDVDRYLNIPNIINTPPRSNSVQTANSVPVSVTNNIVSNNTEENVNIISSIAITNVINESTPVSNIDTSCSHENSANSDISINNVTNMSDVGTPLNMENSRDADSNFEGIQLYNEDSVSSMTSQDIRKNLNNPNRNIIIENHSIKQEPSSSTPCTILPSKIETFKPIGNPYFSINLIPNDTKQYISPFLIPEPYFINYSTGENEVNKKEEIPLNYSAQKYYESVSNGNFDVPVISGEQLGSFVCEDGYSILTFSNQQDLQTSFSYLPNQIEVGQFLSDPCNMIPVELETNKNDNNCILDLSKEAETEQNIDVDTENNSLDKFLEVSNRICEELSKII